MARYSALVALAAACGDLDRDEGSRRGVHPEGWKGAHGAAVTSSAEGPLAAAASCEGCHADDTGPTCDSCHEPGPTGCKSCHETLGGTHEAHGATPERIGSEACGTCHVVPESWRDENHLKDRGPADVRLSGLAKARGARPAYAEGKCSDVACHAGPGARTPSPSWGSTLAEPTCGSCHGLPPPSPHPVSTRCQDCHGSVAPSGIRNIEEPHPNGRVVVDELNEKECDACHGRPPESGAHVKHLSGESAVAVACETCHLVPVEVTDEGHLDDGTRGAEVRLAAVAGPEARFENGTCSQVACHGGDSPAWTGEAPCGSCHGVPPRGHAPGACSSCHPNAEADGRPRDPARHADGRVDNTELGVADCDVCHGVGAPMEPPAPHGRHTAQFPCATCHPAPGEVRAEGHLNGNVEIRLQPLPDRRTGEPGTGAFEDGRCNVPTCHGGGRPAWRAVPERLTCDSCHGNPPPNHAAMACEGCHGGNRHADGTLDLHFREGCGDCHGSPPQTGAHVAHTEPRFSRPVECASCHLVPATVDAEGHIGPPPAEVTPLGGTYDPQTGRCSDVPCHTGRAGARDVVLDWRAAPSAAGDCGACHGVPPPGHGPVDCVHCHAPTAGPGVTIAEPMNHVDGTLDRSGAAVLPP